MEGLKTTGASRRRLLVPSVLRRRDVPVTVRSAMHLDANGLMLLLRRQLRLTAFSQMSTSARKVALLFDIIDELDAKNLFEQAAGQGRLPAIDSPELADDVRLDHLEAVLRSVPTSTTREHREALLLNAGVHVLAWMLADREIAEIPA